MVVSGRGGIDEVYHALVLEMLAQRFRPRLCVFGYLLLSTGPCFGPRFREREVLGAFVRVETNFWCQGVLELKITSLVNFLRLNVDLLRD